MVGVEPTAAEIRAWAEELSDGALLCRTNPGGHAPVPTTVDQSVLKGTKRQVYIQYYRCRNRCGCTWSQIVDMANGRQHALHIHYPPGQDYLAPGIGRISGAKKDIVRLVAFERRMKGQKK